MNKQSIYRGMMNVKKFFVLLVTIVLTASCAPKPERYEIRSQNMQGIVTVTPKTVEFEGRLTGGGPNEQFWLFTQEEGVGEGNPNWTAFSCTVTTYDATGIVAYTNCSATVERRYRQNAIVLAKSEDPQTGRVERVEYRANLIIGQDEQFRQWDYNYSLMDIEPTDVKNAMRIYHDLGLEMEINADYNRYNPSTYSNEILYPYSRGYYLTFITKTACGGIYTENHVNLYKWDGSKWVFADSLRLEDVDFEGSGTHEFNVEGITLQLTFHDHYKCRKEYETINIP